MAEYISRDWLLTHTHTGMDTIQMMQTMIDAPAADVVAVVRCRECKYSAPNGIYGCTCYHFKQYETHGMGANDFCSFGERKGGDGLTKGGIIVDDDLKHISTTIKGEVDRKNPRTEIEVISEE